MPTSLENELAAVSITEPEETNGVMNGDVKASGSNPLPKKQPLVYIEGARMVNIATNIRKITLAPNTTLYPFRVTVNYVFRRQDGREVAVEMSNSRKKDKEHEDDKRRCRYVYEEAVKRSAKLREGRCFYDSQHSLWALSDLGIGKEPLSLQMGTEVSRRPNFIRADFLLERGKGGPVSSVDISNSFNQCPLLADRRIIEALGVMTSDSPNANEGVFTVKGNHHFLVNSRSVGINTVRSKEGRASSSVGATKSVKTLEGTGLRPGVHITTEMKVSLFHPSNASLIYKMRSIHGFRFDMNKDEGAARRIIQNLKGVVVELNYGPYKDLGRDAYTLEISGLGDSSRRQTFQFDGNLRTVYEHFQRKYNIEIRYSDLMTIEAKSRRGNKCYFPPEVLLIAPNQNVRNEQMINGEEKQILELAAVRPAERFRNTEMVSKAVGIISEDTTGSISFSEPLNVNGMVLEGPNVRKDHRLAEPMTLLNWEIIFVCEEKEEKEIGEIAKILWEEMRNAGMRVEFPFVGNVRGYQAETFSGVLEEAFKFAKNANRQLLFFISPEEYETHNYIKEKEREYDVLTQHATFKTIKKILTNGLKDTLTGIILKINMKLCGFNYNITSTALEPKTLVMGFSLSQKGFGSNDSNVISVGYAMNSLSHTHKFFGGYEYAPRQADMYGGILPRILKETMRKTKKQRDKPEEVVIYFHGISEGQLALVRDKYVETCKEVFSSLGTEYKPDLIVIASTQAHNERLFKQTNSGVRNLDPGTVVDTGIVSPAYNEFYHAGTSPFKGTTKATKYTVVYAPEPVNMRYIETLTNDLCHYHQITAAPTNLPAPIFIAGECAKRGNGILSVAESDIVNRNNLAEINENYSSAGLRNLGNRRYNA